MKIKYPASTNGFTPCNTADERVLYNRMIELMHVVDGTKAAINTAKQWREHDEELQHKNALIRYIAELRDIVKRLHIMRPDLYEIQ